MQTTRTHTPSQRGGLQGLDQVALVDLVHRRNTRTLGIAGPQAVLVYPWALAQDRTKSNQQRWRQQWRHRLFFGYPGFT